MAVSTAVDCLGHCEVSSSRGIENQFDKRLACAVFPWASVTQCRFSVLDCVRITSRLNLCRFLSVGFSFLNGNF